jgi:hypothetical protein
MDDNKDATGEIAAAAVIAASEIAVRRRLDAHAGAGKEHQDVEAEE